MSPPHVRRERGTGGRLLWAFKDLLHYTIQLLFIRQCTAINQTAMFCWSSSGTSGRGNLFRLPVCLEKTLCKASKLSTCCYSWPGSARPGPARHGPPSVKNSASRRPHHGVLRNMGFVRDLQRVWESITNLIYHHGGRWLTDLPILELHMHWM